MKRSSRATSWASSLRSLTGDFFTSNFLSWRRTDQEVRSLGGSCSFILAALRRFEEWADSRPADVSEPPRSVGKVETTLRGTTLTRSVGSYTHWNVLRVLDRHRALPEAERQRVEKAIAGTGWEELLAYAPRHRLTKRGFALAFA